MFYNMACIRSRNRESKNKINKIHYMLLWYWHMFMYILVLDHQNHQMSCLGLEVNFSVHLQSLANKTFFH